MEWDELTDEDISWLLYILNGKFNTETSDYIERVKTKLQKLKPKPYQIQVKQRKMIK